MRIFALELKERLAQILVIYTRSILDQSRGFADDKTGAEPPIRQIVTILRQIMCKHEAENQIGLLKLVAEGLSDIDAFKEGLEISRTMIYTHLRDLKDQALIVETPNGYDLTLAGKLLLI